MAKTVFVNASSAGGDGTTNNESGLTAAYASLSSMEANEGGISFTESITVECDIGSTDVNGDTTGLTFAGSTPTATNFFRIIPSPTGTNGSGADQRHAGTFDTAKYHLSIAGQVIGFADPFVYVDGLQLQHNRAGSDSAVNANIGSSDSRLRQCLVRKNAGTGTNNGVSKNYSGGTFQVDNCIFWVEAATFGSGIANRKSNAGPGTIHAYSNTIFGATNGIECLGTDGVLARNNIMGSCTNATSGDIAYSFAAGTDFNMTDNASMGYAGNVTGGNPANDQLSATLGFVNSAADDYHITSSSTADGNGTNTFSAALHAMTEDIDRDTRAADIGADEIVGGATVVLAPLYRNQLRHMLNR